MNLFQDRTPYSGSPVGNSLGFMPLDNSLCVLSRFLLDGEGTYEEERNMRFSLSKPKEITWGMKRIWESKMGTPSSARIIQDVDMELKALKIVYRANGSAVEGIADRNGNIRKVVGEGKIVSWEVHGPKARGASSNSPKRYSCTVICWSCVWRKTQHHWVLPWHNCFLRLENSRCEVTR